MPRTSRASMNPSSGQTSWTHGSHGELSERWHHYLHCLFARVLRFNVNSCTAAVASRCFLKHAVADASWSLWNEVFNVLDADNAGCLNMQKLASSKQMTPEVCEHICRKMGVDTAGSFTNEAFLERMADISHCRFERMYDKPEQQQLAWQLAKKNVLCTP